MNDACAAAKLAALGHEVRLGLFRLLVRAGPDGLNTGEIGRLMGSPPSTLAHHLGALVTARLATQEKRGRETINRADFRAMRALLDHVESECCVGAGDAQKMEYEK